MPTKRMTKRVKRKQSRKQKSKKGGNVDYTTNLKNCKGNLLRPINPLTCENVSYIYDFPGVFNTLASSLKKNTIEDNKSFK